MNNLDQNKIDSCHTIAMDNVDLIKKIDSCNRFPNTMI